MTERQTTEQNKQKPSTTKRRERKKKLCLSYQGYLILLEIYDLVDTIHQLVVISKLCGTNVLQKIAKMTLIHHSTCHMALRSHPH